MDSQVKIRGYRIELGEIETVLSQHPAVLEAVVVAQNDALDKRLVAYVVHRPGTDISVNELRGFLKHKLPDYMVPSVFVVLDALPLTPNGKIDRKALPAPDQSRPELEQGFVAPRTPVEELLTGIWAEVLKVEKVGIHDNFFDLGGHSLLATQVISRIRTPFRIDVPLRRLFEAPTVAGLAQAIQELEISKGASDKATRLYELVAKMSPIMEHQANKLNEQKLESLLAELESISDEKAESQLATESTSNRTGNGDE
jgi:acyl carrier protein